MQRNITQIRHMEMDVELEMGEDIMQPAYETGGELLPDGHHIELIKKPCGDLKLLDSRPLEVRLNATHAYLPPKVHASVSEVLILPTQRLPCGSTEELFNKTLELFSGHGFSHVDAKLLAYFAIATWFVDQLPIAPCLVITGPGPEAHLVLQLLHCVVRHGLPIANLGFAELKRLPMCVQPTLLIGRLQPSLYKVLQISMYPGDYVPLGNELVELHCAKAGYAGMSVAERQIDEPILIVNLVPSRKKLSLVSPAARQEIASFFQPRLLDYRLKHVRRISASDFDVPSLPSSLTVLAQALGSCVFDAPDLQAGVADLLIGHHELEAAGHWIDPKRVVVEVLLQHCHADTASGRIGIGQIAEAAATILQQRGEATRMTPKYTGLIARTLGLSPTRNNQGFALLLTEPLRRKIHALAHAYEVELVTESGMICPHCDELAEGGPQTT